MTELSLTRIFSVTMYYHFAFMAISIALFGLSASGVYVFLMRDRWRDTPTERLLAGHAFAFTPDADRARGAGADARRPELHAVEHRADERASTCCRRCRSSPAAPTITLAISPAEREHQRRLRRRSARRGAGCLVLMPALNLLGAPGAIVAAAVLGLGAGAVLSGPAVPRRWLAAARRPSPSSSAPPRAGGFDVSTTKGHENHPVLFSKWNSFSRIGVYDQPYGAWSLSDKYTGPLPDTRLMDIDSAAGTQILNFGGDLQRRCRTCSTS